MMWICVLLPAIWLVNYHVHAREVEVDIQAHWPKYTTNILTEISEYLYDQHDIAPKSNGLTSDFAGNGMYWSYVNSLCPHSMLIDQLVRENATVTAVEEVTKTAYSKAYSLLPDSLHAMFKHLVGMGEYKPTVRFYQLLSQQYDSVNPCSTNHFALIEYGNRQQIVCTVKELEEVLVQASQQDQVSSEQAEAEGSMDLSWDHIFTAEKSQVNTKAPKPHVVLYGTIGTSGLCEFVASLQTQSHLVHSFAIRNSFHALTPIQSTTMLQGYGVYLDIKNMEYHNFDDEKTAASASASEGEGAPDEISKFDPKEEILGINVAQLASAFPSSPRSHFSTLRRQLLFANATAGTSSSSSATTAGSANVEMKLWKVKDLGLQLVQQFLTTSQSASPLDALDEMKETVWNFPMYASLLSSAKVSGTIREELLQYAQMTPLPQILAPNNLYLHGKAIRLDGNTFNVYDLLHTLHNEYKQLIQLHSAYTGHHPEREDWLALPSSFAGFVEEIVTYGSSSYGVDTKPHYVLHTSANIDTNITSWETAWRLQTGPSTRDEEHDDYSMPEDDWSWDRLVRDAGMPGAGGGGKKEVGSASYRIDVSQDSKQMLYFVNNLERDRQYRAWPKSLQALFYPSWSLPMIRRNLYTIVITPNVFTQEGALLFSQMNMMVEQQYPLRFAFVLTGCDGNTGSGGEEAMAQQLFCWCYGYLKQTASTGAGGPGVALDFVKLFVEERLSRRSGGSRSEEEVWSVFEHVLYSSTAAKKHLPYTKTTKATYVQLVTSFLQTHSFAHVPRLAEQDVMRSQISTAWDYIKQVNAYIQNRGLPENLYILNGQLVQEATFQSHTFMTLLGKEQSLYQQAVQQGWIQEDSKSLYNDLLSVGRQQGWFTVYPKYTRLLQQDQVSIDQKEYLPYFPRYRGGKGAGSTGLPVWGESILGEKVIEQLVAGGYFVILSASSDREVIDNAKQQSVSGLTSSSHIATPTTFLASFPVLSTTATEAEVSTGAIDSMLAALESVSQQQTTGSSFRMSFLPTSLFGGDEGEKKVCTEQTCSAVDVKDIPSDAVAIAWLVQNFPRVYRENHSDQVCGEECVAMYNSLLHHVRQHAASSFSNVLQFLTTTFPSFPSELVESLPASLPKRLQAHNDLVQAIDRYMHRLPTGSQDGEILMSVHGRMVRLPASDVLSSAEVDLFLRLETSTHTTYIKNLLDLIDSLPTKACPSSAQEAKCTEDIHHAKGNLLLEILSYLAHNKQNAFGVSSSKGPTGSSKERLFFPTVWKVCATQLGHTFPHLVHTLLPSSSSDGSISASAMIGNQLQITAILDPLSLAGQRAFQVIHYLVQTLSLPVTLILLPKDSYSEFPIKSFYRYMLPTAEDREDAIDEKTRFEELPRQHVLTMRLDTPEPWNVQQLRASQDIDNLRCTSHACGDPVSENSNTTGTSETTHVSYALKNVLVAGQCFQTTVKEQAAASTGVNKRSYLYNPVPHGLQLVLTPTLLPALSSDTMVMQNLGYYQLLAEVGLYTLTFSPETRSALLYSFPPSPLNPMPRESQSIVVKHFHEEIRSLVVMKRAGLEDEQLLEAPQITRPGHKKASKKPTAASTSSSLWKSITTSLFGTSPASSGVSSDTSAAAGKESHSTALQSVTSSLSDDDKIHVFSLATGQLYERLLRIMMISVVKHTRSRPVKFWLFENYLSAQFKQSVTILTRLYNFEVAYVTYKWPQWLIPQTSQQRIIWGYKILFLDVLFPQTLSRVIYIDADQVIRADLEELWTLDLQGAPYAYPPFCTSRQEMVGYQFWQHGYWKDHLQEKPYHISALYVVDLTVFRANAVGDQLRGIYNNLARDPNSLANLDQDLPNYAQWQIPIYTLPVEWLWCETWCAESTKPYAKTIDLCNNPMHKEPKLDMARRVISGELFDQSWVELDEEIRVALAQQQVVPVTNNTQTIMS